MTKEQFKKISLVCPMCKAKTLEDVKQYKPNHEQITYHCSDCSWKTSMVFNKIN